MKSSNATRQVVNCWRRRIVKFQMIENSQMNLTGNLMFVFILSPFIAQWLTHKFSRSFFFRLHRKQQWPLDSAAKYQSGGITENIMECYIVRLNAVQCGFSLCCNFNFHCDRNVMWETASTRFTHVYVYLNLQSCRGCNRTGTAFMGI